MKYGIVCCGGGLRRQAENLEEMSFTAVLACVII